MEGSIRVSDRVLRLAGLLPENGTEQVTVEGGESTPQPNLISQVFGKPYVVGDKTIIPVVRVRFASLPTGRQSWKMGDGYGMSTPVALIEVSEKGVCVQSVFDMLPVILGGMLVGAWNVYWIMRTIREWRRS